MRLLHLVFFTLAALSLTTCAPVVEVLPHPEPTLETRSGTPWVQERVRAVAELYNIAPAGQAWMESYDLRQMMGRPGWFGSYGNKSWAGVGQAKPASVLHELTHSYWGAFPVTGFPNLSWEKAPWNGLPTALQQYRLDLETFILQPPDSYEPLRERFRNFSNLSRGDDPDLFHFGETDLVQSTGGDLDLIPPILRKYFDRLLQPGPSHTWHEAITWYLGLPKEEHRVADVYIGLAHFPLDRYDALRPEEATTLPAGVTRVVEQEERQRLLDFAEQFDLIKETQFSLTDAAAVDRGFQFWKDYLGEMRALHRRHPEVLKDAGGAKGARLAAALNTFLQAEEMAESEQVVSFRTAFAQDPSLLDFAVLLPGRVLIQLFAQEDPPSTPTSAAAVIRIFNSKLARYAQEADQVLERGRGDPASGSAALERFLQSLSDDEQGQDLSIIFHLLRDADKTTTQELVNRMSAEVLLGLLENNPGVLRNDNVRPGRLLQVLQVIPSAPTQTIAQGIQTLLEHSSGNFTIDRPATEMAYQVIAEMAPGDPQGALDILETSDIPLLPFIEGHTEAARRLLLSDLPRAAALVARDSGFAYSPWRILHGAIVVDPDLAARLVAELERRREESIVQESVIVFAFDAPRLRTNPDLPLSLHQDRAFLERLADLLGAEWLQSTVQAALTKYQEEIRQQRMDPHFIEAYRETLSEVLSRAEGEGTARLRRLFNAAFAQTGLTPPR